MDEEPLRCPNCGAYVAGRLTLCPHCHHPLEPLGASGPAAEGAAPPPADIFAADEGEGATPADDTLLASEHATPPETRAADEPEPDHAAAPTTLLPLPASPDATPPATPEAPAEQAGWADDQVAADEDARSYAPENLAIAASAISEPEGDELTPEEAAPQTPPLETGADDEAERVDSEASTPAEATAPAAPDELPDFAEIQAPPGAPATGVAADLDALAPGTTQPHLAEQLAPAVGAPVQTDMPTTPVRQGQPAVEEARPPGRLSAPDVRPAYLVPPAPYTPPPVAPPARLTPPAYVAPPAYSYAPDPGVAYLHQRVAAYVRGGYETHTRAAHEATLSYGKPMGAGTWLLALVTIIGALWYLLILALSGFRSDAVYITLEQDGRVYEDGPGAAHVRHGRARTGRRWSVFGAIVLLLSLLMALVLAVIAGVFLAQDRYQAALREAYPAVTLFEEHFSATQADPDDVALARDGAVAFAIVAVITAVGIWGGATLFVVGTVHAAAYGVRVPPLPGWG